MDGRTAALHHDVIPPADLDAAFEHWQFVHAHDRTPVNSRMWCRSITVPESDQGVGHGFILYATDLRCEPWKHSDKHEGLYVRQRADVSGDLRTVRMKRHCGQRERRGQDVAGQDVL